MAKSIKKEETRIVNNKSSKKVNNKYVNYNVKCLINFLVVIIFFTILIVSINNSFSLAKEKVINYTAKSNLDYSVFLKDNNFYDTKYLPKDMIYVATLVDKIPVTFNYSFAASEKINVDFEYSIVGKLRITNEDKTKSYYEKTYTLLEPKTITTSNSDTFNISETIDIDYDEYNAIANTFKANYGLESNSDFTLYLTVNKKSGEENSVILNSSDVMSVVIPLSEKAINISLDYKDINEESSIINNSSIIIKNYKFIVAAGISLIICIIYTIKLLRLLNLSKSKKTKHDKIVNKIIKEYDRLVVETTNLPEYSGKEMIKIASFEELLDVRDNLKLPIMHYTVSKHRKSVFYICHNNTFYTYVVKESELGE